jgi:alpha-glucosidase
MDIPEDKREDPTFHRTNGEVVGRDGCRVPIPWRTTGASFGFSDTGASWLPQPEYFGELSVEAQAGSAGSTLEMYREALRLRRQLSPGEGTLSWLDSPEDTLAFTINNVTVVAAMGEQSLAWPAAELLLASSPDVVVVDGQITLPPDTAAWLRL